MDENKKPMISVIMPVYNAEKYLREAIESILSQTFSDFEFLILNDGSTDNSIDIIRSYSDSRILIHNSVVNQGLIFQLNKGLDLSRGKYIARMDADDISLPERLARQVEFLETHRDIGVLGTGVQIMDTFGNILHTIQFSSQQGVLRWCLCFYNPLVHPTVMMRREIVKLTDGYDSDMLHAEDYDLWRRMSGITRFSNLKDVLLILRKHNENVSNVHFALQRQNSIQISSKMILQILNENVSTDTVQRLWNHEFKTAYDMLPVAELVYRLCLANVVDDELSIIEKRVIRRDAAMRIYGLIRPWVKNVNVWGYLARVCYLDPLLILRVVKGRFHHIFHMRPRLLCWSF